MALTPAERGRRYRERHPERARAAVRRWRAANREADLAYQEAWRRAHGVRPRAEAKGGRPPKPLPPSGVPVCSKPKCRNPAVSGFKRCETCRRNAREGARRHRQRHLDPFHVVLRLDPCAYCGGAGGEVDHLHPVALGGSHEAENLTGCCRSCNSRKHTRSMLAFLLVC